MEKQGMILKANLDHVSCAILETPEQRNSMSITKEGGIRNGSVFLHLKGVLSSLQVYKCDFRGGSFLQNNTGSLLYSSNNNAEFKQLYLSKKPWYGADIFELLDQFLEGGGGKSRFIPSIQ